MTDLITYPLQNNINISLNIENNDIWISQKQMALLFGVTTPTINEHLKNIFQTNELDKNSVIRNFRITASDDKNYDIKHYNLDAIISVGYRINSQQATAFRQWATQILRQYIQDGYVINEIALVNNPEKLDELANKIRALRATEKSVYEKVRECFKISASDYQPNAQEVKTFYALLQDKFHHAVTKMTASKIIMDRADHTASNMGLVSFNELIPTKQEAKIGKNYLTKNELHRIYLLSEQFLLHAESTALMGKKMTMQSLHKYLDDLLVFNGYPVFDGYQDYLKDFAIAHAEQEYQHYINLKKLEMLGVKINLLEYENGNYQAEYQDQLNAISMQKLRNHFANISKQIT